MINKHMKRCSTPHVSRKWKIKQHELPVHSSIRVATIQNTHNTMTARMCSNRGSYIADGKAIWCSHFGRQLSRVLQPNLFLYDPAITFLEIYPKELKICSHKNLQMDVYSSFIHNFPKWEATKMSFSLKGYIKSNISRQRNVIYH